MPTPNLQCLLSVLSCPVTHSPLKLENGFLVSQTGRLRYPIEKGIPKLLRSCAVLPEGVHSMEQFQGLFAAKLVGKM
jgi:uncharacterized protein YbaR (Trm112 family)